MARNVHRPRRTTPAPRRPVGRPADTDSAETRQALLEAGVTCFAARGLARTTLREVAIAAGLTTGTLYHHYRTKEALYVASYVWAVEEMYAEFEQAIVGFTTLEDRLVATVECTRRLAQERSALLNIVLRAWVEHGETGGQPLPDPPAVGKFVRTLVDDAARNGEIEWADRRQIFNVYRTIGWGMTAIALTGDDHLEHAAAGVRRVLRGSMFNAPAY
jgi:AcrR family transcriptional regulator